MGHFGPGMSRVGKITFDYSTMGLCHGREGVDCDLATFCRYDCGARKQAKHHGQDRLEADHQQQRDRGNAMGLFRFILTASKSARGEKERLRSSLKFVYWPSRSRGTDRDRTWSRLRHHQEATRNATANRKSDCTLFDALAYSSVALCCRASLPGPIIQSR